MLAQTLAQQQTVIAGQHEVEDDQVGGLAFHGRPQFGATGRGLHRVAVLQEKFLQQREDFKVIVHDQQVAHRQASLGWVKASSKTIRRGPSYISIVQ